MSIFLDTSRKRKVYFRLFIVGLSVFLLVCLFALTWSVFFRSPQRPALTYAEASEAYHYYYSSANDNKVALTFDDGPNPEVSEKLMDALEAEDAPATFFYIGKNIFLYPRIVADASKRGFTIGNQSFTHSTNVQKSATRLSLELHATEYLISRITGHSSFFYRPPYLLGIGIDPTMNPYIPPPQDVLWVMENGYNPVGSDINPEDYLATSADGVTKRVVEAIQRSPKGRILLLHEQPYTLESIHDIVKSVRDAGYTIVPLSELLSPPSQLAITHTLHLGDTDASTGGEVSQLQWFLFKNGDLDPYFITGVFGTATKSALTRFQVEQGLVNGQSTAATVGIADAQTRTALEKVSTSVLSASAASASLQSPHAGTLLGSALSYLYVNFFAGIHMFLSSALYLTLFLVLVRCLLMLVLLVFKSIRTWRTGSEELMEASEEGISVLIPAYNEEENIRATIESILRSTYQRKEVIVVDDGSTDSTGDVVRSVIADNPSFDIRLLQVTNGGKASALNHGLAAAQYDICTILDADAVLEEDALKYFALHFTDPELGAVAGKVRTTNSMRVLDMLQTLEYAIGQNIDKRALSLLSAVGVVPGPAGAWRRSLVLEAGGFSTDTLVEDQDMTLTLMRADKKILYEERAIAYTETPHTVKNFLKQRFRWVYGTMQCFWKHKGVVLEKPLHSMSLIVMPNILIFNIVLPLLYPLADSAFIVGIFINDWTGLIAPFVFFTMIDLSYAIFGVWREPQRFRLLCYVPLQRIIYRQLLYYTVMRGVIRASEGTGSGWNKFPKIGETQRFYFSSQCPGLKAPITASTEYLEEKPLLLPSGRRNEVPALSSGMLASVTSEDSTYRSSILSSTTSNR